MSKPHAPLPDNSDGGGMAYIRARILVNEDGCWIWQLSRIRGYGQAEFRGLKFRVHRATYTWLVGPIPDGLTIDHLCRVPPCCNPAPPPTPPGAGHAGGEQPPAGRSRHALQQGPRVHARQHLLPARTPHTADLQDMSRGPCHRAAHPASGRSSPDAEARTAHAR